MANVPPKSLLQAESLWKILDELAESNPEGYKKFMDKMLKENKDWMKPPDPLFCIRTLKLPETSNHHIFINICKWDKVPAPKDETERISVIASKLRDIPDCSAKHSVIDLCFHTTILDETTNMNQCRKIISSMALEYVEGQTGLKLLKSYKILTIKYKGDTKDLRRFLFHSGLSRRPAEKPMGTAEQSVLHGLSNIVQERAGDHSKPSGLPGDIKVGHNDKNSNSTTITKPLIEEVLPATVKSNAPPKHCIQILDAVSGRSRCIVVVVDLPNVQSGAQCELDVSKDDLLVSSPYNGNLLVCLPEKGNEDETTSTFNKTTCQLTITIPVSMQ